ncbi:MAG: hypothetical protein M0C28_37630 [Candidatus Moduliflexus flocculans]|nr:hypothetical protein [Candidatus Moduliflexus flocculans]
MRGFPLFQGKASLAGTLAATVYLPSAPEPRDLTLQAEGFEDRTVVIANMVEFCQDRPLHGHEAGFPRFPFRLPILTPILRPGSPVRC